jgi:hypothetical protein
VECAQGHQASVGRVVELPALGRTAPPPDFGKLLAEETEKWDKVIRAANIKPE